MNKQQTAIAYAAFAAGGIAIGFALSRLLKTLFNQPERHIAQSGNAVDQKPDLRILMEAMRFSAEKHRDQRRKNPKQHPYINHPIRVARLLAVDAGIEDTDVIVAALLHDTVEDTETSLEEVEALFGPSVAKIVDEVSDDKSLPKEKRKQLQIDHAPFVSPKAKLVKLADKLDNLTELLVIIPVGWQPERVLQYFDWSEKVIAGLRGTDALLERKLDAVLARRAEAAQLAKGSV